MATVMRKREGGQLAQKNLRGLMRRRRRRQALSNPLPPLSLVSLCEFTVSLCKTPFHMTYIVFGYWQGAAAQ
jgi:hypothetical protein